MNNKTANIYSCIEKIEDMINTLPPKVKTVVVITSTVTICCCSISEACKSITVLAKEGLPPIVENINKCVIMLKSSSSNELDDRICETQVADESSIA